ncbi:RagB/SusD family nutrient uptake outer membrane protein [Compostibacter hankyongensis]|uniref:RagB/SusD family nutrient uptake outer membrane protein n=1 Tax=Compostibacter hankyongensis TaxID=1007089 RepID=A0ABP8FK69_9BACT
MKTKIIITALLGFTMAGCSKFLEVIPETSLSSVVFFKTEKDFEQGVNATYVPLRTIFNSYAWGLGELHSDNSYYARNPLFGAVDNTENLADFSVPTANGITTNSFVLNQYRQDYLIISRANQVLSSIDDADFDEDAKNNLKGQALFLRAYAYFELVRYFGKVPLHLEPVAARQDAALPLSSVDSVYMQIIKDAGEAGSLLLPKSTQQAGRATSGAAKTLLANVYIVRKNWSEAEKLLKEVVDSKEYSLMPDYNNAFSTSTGNKNNAESVFEVQFMEGSAGYSGNFLYSFLPRPMTADEVETITGTSNPQPLSEEGNNIPTPDIIAAYEPGDKRKDASIAYITLSTSLRTNKVFPYIKKYAKKHALQGNTGTNWPVYRYSEVLLFLAEALNEQGKTSDAAPYLNEVRKRAGLAATTASGKDAMRQAIYKERRVELAFENKRWFDLVRTGRVQDVITAYGERVKSHPENYYYPSGSVPPNNAFTQLETVYPLPADEAALSPYF